MKTPPEVMGTFACPHCGEILLVKVAPGKREPRAAGPLCACGHDASHHVTGTGRCLYGHDTATGGCRDCKAFRPRRRGAARPKSAAEAPTDDERNSWDDAFKKPAQASPGDDRRREKGLHGIGECPLALLLALNEGTAESGMPTQPIEYVTVRAGYSPRSGGTAKALRELSSLGLADMKGGRLLEITAAGVTLAREPWAQAAAENLLPSNVLDHWAGKIGQCADLLLRAMVLEYPRVLTREQLGAHTGYRHTSGGFAKAIRDLDKMGLAHDLAPSKALIAAMGPA